jgi:RNA polymerase sigma-70 factor (ECF subfamily)
VNEDATAELEGWLARLGQGDNGACEPLINLAYDRLTTITRRLLFGFPALRGREDVPDVLHNSLPRFIQALEAVRPSTAHQFYGLAVLQIRRVMLEMVRKPPQPTPFTQTAPGAEPDESGTYDPKRLAAWTEFHRLVDNLPSDERQLVELLFYQELSQERVAEMLRVDKSTVKRRWRAVRQKLSQQIRGWLAAT